MADLGRVFTFIISNIRQFRTSVFRTRLNVLRSSADLQLYDSEFQTEGTLTLKAFANNVNVVWGTDSSSLSDDRNVHAGR